MRKLGLAGLIFLAGCGINQIIPKHITLSKSHKYLLKKSRTELTQWQWEELENILEQEQEELSKKIETYLDPILKKTDNQGEEIRFHPWEMNNVNMFVTKTNKQRVFLHQLSHFDHAKECSDEFLKGGMVTLETNHNNQTRWQIIDIRYLDSIKREPDSDIATLKNGRELRGRWIGNQETSDFYHREKTRARNSAEVPDSELIGISGDKYIKIPVKDIQEIFFDAKSAKVKQGKSHPRKVELRDGTTFTAQNAFVLDYYGYNLDSDYMVGTWRYWYNGVRRRLEDNLIDEKETFAEVEFTGGFLPEDSQNRLVIYTLENGTKITGVLEMHHENLTTKTSTPIGAPPVFGHRTLPSYPSGYSFTHTSKPDSHRTGRKSDKFYIERPFGATIVPLDDVKRVTVILEAELQEIPQPFIEKNGN